MEKEKERMSEWVVRRADMICETNADVCVQSDMRARCVHCVQQQEVNGSERECMSVEVEM